jgi:O-antigen biosynthesis protein
MKKQTAEPTSTAPQRLRTSFSRLDDQTFCGYIFDESALNRRFVVELLLDGYPFKIAKADTYVHELSIEGVGDGCYGFALKLAENVLSQTSIVELRIANSEIPVGSPIALDASEVATSFPPTSKLLWLGGLRMTGWCVDDNEKAPIVTAIIDGDRVAEAKALRWANVGTPENPQLGRRFDLHLPERFADGCVRRVHIIRENGESFPGSPLTILAYRDGLQNTIEQFTKAAPDQLRGLQFDRLFPMAMPFSEYQHWCDRFPLARGKYPADDPVAIALVGTVNPELSLKSIQQNDCENWVAAALPEAEAHVSFRIADLQEFLMGDAKESQYVIFTHSSARFEPDALLRFMGAIKDYPDAVAAYSDFNIVREDGVKWPVALPAFDYERMLEQGYCAHLFALSSSLARQAAMAGADNLFRLFNFMFDSDGPLISNKVVHIPGALASLSLPDNAPDAAELARATQEHLQARKIVTHITQSPSTLFPAIHVLRSTSPQLTTIVIPSRNRLALLRSCIDSILPAAARGDVEILIVDNGSTEPEMLPFLNDLAGRAATVLRVPGAFNFPHLNNVAARYAKGEYLCLLNNDVQAGDDYWLLEMLARISEEDVGAVGALLLWPSGVIQHGGTVLGPNFAATHAFCDRFQNDPGYTDLLCVAHECSAVTAACLLTRRRDYLDVGGMDEVHFPVNFNDVDYCLKLRAQGKRIVFTPHARLHHLESASRGDDTRPDRSARFARELQSLRARWGEFLVADSYYNPTLSLDALPFSALAWPPRTRAPRINTPPVARQVPPGF